MTYKVAAVPHPLSGRVVFDMDSGTTLEDAIVEAAERGDVPLKALGNAAVMVGDTLVPKDQWKRVRPKAGQTVAIKAMAADPASLTLAAVTSALVTAAIGVGLNLLISLIFKPPKQSDRQPDGPTDPRYTIQGIRNVARPYGPIPKIYGRRVKFFPVLAAQAYSETAWGEEQYVRMLFDVGYGPLSISDIKIGDTPIEQLEDCEVQTRQGYDSDTPITLFPAQVREAALNIQLRQVDGFVLQTTTVDTDEATLDVQFPGGLQRVTNKSQKFGVSVSFEIQIRLASGGAWQTPTLTAPASGIFLSGGAFEIQANSKAAVRRTVRIVFPSRDQWQVQIRRITVDDQAVNTGENQSVTTEDSYLTAFRSFRNDAPVLKTGIARIAVRCRATNQLNGTIDQLNCTVQAILPVWNGSTWVEQETRSPAWAFCDVLRGSANARPLTASRIDLTQMLAWDAQCTADGITFDAALEEVQPVKQRLEDIAATANAALKTSGGLYSVAMDNTKTEIVQHFSVRNSRNLIGTQVLADRPHGYKVRFPNEATQHQYDEIVAYEDGYSSANATQFEVLELPYTTSATQAYKRARRELFTRRLRPAVYSKETDIRHIVCEPGDLVRVTDDVALWGGSGARVKALVTSGSNTAGVTLDAPVTMESGQTYNLRVQMTDGTSLVIPVDLDIGEQTDLTFTTPVATASGPVVGNHVLFGEVGSESVELIVRSIEPLDDLGARITFEDYAPLIQTAATGSIPDFDPQITLPPLANRATPPRVQILSIDSDEDALIRASDGTLTSRILLSVALEQGAGNVPAEVIQARYREAGTTGDYQWLGAIPAQGGEVSVLPVQDGTEYTVQLRSVSQFGATSDWTEISHVVVGKTTPPPSVDRFYRQGNALTWPYPDPPLDLAGFVIKANYGTSTDWGQARPLHVGVVSAPPFDISTLHGTQTILIKAVDTSGIESETAASVTIDLGDLLVSNVVVTQSEGPTWGGSLTGGTDTGTDIEADLVSSPPFWGADSSLFWGADGDLFWDANTYDSMVYTATYTPTTDILGDGILKIDETVVGDYTIDYRISTSGTFWGADADPFWGADDDLFWDADTIGEWTPFPGSLGPFDTTADSYSFRLTTVSGPVQGVCSQFDIVIDVPDIDERFEDVAIAVTTGTRLTLTKTYRAIKTVNITRQYTGAGVDAGWVDKQANAGAAGGPLIQVKDGAGAIVAGVVDVIIQGY